MAIQFPLTMPNTKIASMSWRMVDTSTLAISPFTGQQQAQVFPGEWWEVDIAYALLDQDKADPIISILAALRGPEGFFNLNPPLARTVGTWDGQTDTLQVDGDANAGAREFNVKGGPVSETGYLMPGDWIQTRPGGIYHLHRVLQQVDTDAEGKATIDFWPSLRAKLADNSNYWTSFRFGNRAGHFRLKSRERVYEETRPHFYGISLTAIEYLT